MNTYNIKIIRTWWGNFEDKWIDVPKLPLYNNEVVFVWGKDNLKKLKDRGYECIEIPEDEFVIENIYGKKLQVLDVALQKYGEVLMLDWDCFILKPLDLYFRQLLNNKPIQIPLYAHYKDPMIALLEAIPDNDPILLKEDSYNLLLTNLSNLEKGIKKYHWKWDDGLIIPNFGCVYSRDKNLGKDLLNIAKKYKLKALVEEFAMFIYANCSMKEYLSLYQPDYCLGVSERRNLVEDFPIQIIQNKFNNYLKTQINYKPYLEHV